MKKFTFLLAALIVSVCSVMAETVAYTLTPIVGKNSAYATAADIAVGDITWNVTGNVTVNPWRLGGKNITAVDRALYSKTAIAKNISKIEITHAAGNITVNSMKLIVSATANETVEELTGTYTSEGTTIFTRPTGSDWTGKYYKIVYNVTNETNTNKYVAFSEAKFYTDETAAVLQPVFTPEEGKVTDGSFTESFTLTMSCETADATIYYTLDGTNPAEETALTYLAPITIPATSTKVRAIAKKGTDESFETEQVYAFINSPATAYTVTEAKAVIDKALGLDYELYGKGTIKSIKGYYDSKYITYTITDGTNDLTVYDGLGLEKADFAAATDLVIGDTVVVCGKLLKYSGTYEFNKDNYLISLTPLQYTITATANDDAMGTVAGAGKYDRDSEVTLTATANDGYEFVNWTNAANETIGTEATLTFTATQDSTIKANFKAEEPLTPATWYGQEPLTGTLPTYNIAYSIVYEITRNANKTLTVNYTINEEDLTTVKFFARNLIDADKPESDTEDAYLGTFTSNSEGGYTLTTTKKFKDGEVLSLKIYMATLKASKIYTDAFSYTVGSSNTKPAATYTITTTVNDEAMGTVTGAGEYAENAEVTLTATANDGYEFVNWTNAANETIGTEATLTFIATQDSTIKANFKAQEPLAPATWYGQEPLTGTVSGVNYSLVYEITRNSTRTLTFKLALNDEAAAVAGLKITIIINNNQVGYITENFTSGVFTTSGYYTDDDELNIQFYLGSNNDGVYASAFKYIVGSSNNKPTAIDSVSAEAKATKRIVNGVLVIEKNGVRYNAQGVVME